MNSSFVVMIGKSSLNPSRDNLEKLCRHLYKVCLKKLKLNKMYSYRVGHLIFGIWIGYKKKTYRYVFKSMVLLERWTFPLKNESQHHSNDCHGWPYRVPYSNNPISYFQMKPLSTSEAMSISKIVSFGAQKIQTSLLRSRCTHNEWLFGVNYGTVASLGHFSSKMGKWPPLRSMASLTVPCSTNFCFKKLRRMSWTIFGFNSTRPLATQPT